MSRRAVRVRLLEGGGGAAISDFVAFAAAASGCAPPRARCAAPPRRETASPSDDVQPDRLSRRARLCGYRPPGSRRRRDAPRVGVRLVGQCHRVGRAGGRPHSTGGRRRRVRCHMVRHRRGARSIGCDQPDRQPSKYERRATRSGARQLPSTSQALVCTHTSGHGRLRRATSTRFRPVRRHPGPWREISVCGWNITNDGS